MQRERHKQQHKWHQELLYILPGVPEFASIRVQQEHSHRSVMKYYVQCHHSMPLPKRVMIVVGSYKHEWGMNNKQHCSVRLSDHDVCVTTFLLHSSDGQIVKVDMGPFAFESCNCPQAQAPPRNEPMLVQGQCNACT